MGRGGEKVEPETLLYGPRTPRKAPAWLALEEEIFSADLIGEDLPELAKSDADTTVVSVRDRRDRRDRRSGRQRILVSRDGTSSELGCAPSVRVPIATDAYALLPFGNFTHQSLDGGFEQFLWRDGDGCFQIALAKANRGRCEVFYRQTIGPEVHDVQLIGNSSEMARVQIDRESRSIELHTSSIEPPVAHPLVSLAQLEYEPGNIRACLDPDSGYLTAVWSEDDDGRKIIRRWNSSDGERVLHFDFHSGGQTGLAKIDRVAVRGGTTAVLWHDKQSSYLTTDPGERTFNLGPAQFAEDARMIVLQDGSTYTASKSSYVANKVFLREIPVKGDVKLVDYFFPVDGQQFALTSGGRAAFVCNNQSPANGREEIFSVRLGQDPLEKTRPIPGEGRVLLDANIDNEDQGQVLLYDQGRRRIIKASL